MPLMSSSCEALQLARYLQQTVRGRTAVTLVAGFGVVTQLVSCITPGFHWYAVTGPGALIQTLFALIGIGFTVHAPSS